MINNGNVIKKHQKEKNFTILDNGIFQNKNLSFKAKGLLCTLLSLPDNWQFSERGLTALSKDGRDGLRSGLDELEDVGYLKRERVRNDKGQFIHTVYHIHEIPNEVLPKLDNPTLGNPTVYKELKNKELKDKEISNIKPMVDFDKFWELYPNKKAKGQAIRMFSKVINDKETYDLVIEDLNNRHRCKDWQKEKGKFIPHPSTYLNAMGWLDEYETVNDRIVSGARFEES